MERIDSNDREQIVRYVRRIKRCNFFGLIGFGVNCWKGVCSVG